MTRGLSVPVLDHGYVRLVDYMGGDLRIVNAAQASLDNYSEDYGDRERAILRALMREEHGVPFEHVVFTFEVRLPLFLAAQFKKHRMSSWSERSARYDEMDPMFYFPDVTRVQVGKAMSYTYEPASAWVHNSFLADLNEEYMRQWAAYQRALERGVAKEQARIVLPTALYTTATWTINLRSLFNFLHLRNDEHAQGEAVEYAKIMEDLAYSVVPDAITLFRMNGRPKP